MRFCDKLGCLLLVFSMTEPNYSTLTDWYLARLRSSAQEAGFGKFTPRTMLEADSELIRKLVESRASASEKSQAALVRLLRDDNKLLGSAERTIHAIAVIGLLALVFLLVQPG